MKTYAREFLFLPSPRGHRTPALRMALGVAVPLIVLVAIGRTDLTMYAIFGALTGIFGRVEPHWLRLRHQSLAAVLIGSSIVGGVAVADAGPWVLVGMCVLLVGGLSVVADLLRLRPAGPFFSLFAFAASAEAPFAGHLWEAAAAAGFSIALALALGFIRSLQFRRTESQHHHHEPPHEPWSRILAQAARYVVAVGFAGALALGLGWGHFYWAMLAAAVPISAADAAGGLARSVHRVIGTYAGVGLTAALVLIDWTPLAFAFLLACLQFAAELFIISHYSIALVFITPLALMMTQYIAPSPLAGLLGDRVLETTMGAVIAFFVILLSDRRSGTTIGAGRGLAREHDVEG